jgi:hypothetical protein
MLTQKLAAPQPCAGGYCSIIADNGVTAGTTLSTSTTTSITSTFGVTFTMTETENLLVASSSESLALSLSIAAAVAHEAGTSVSQTTSYSVTNSIGQPIGTTMFMAFTPSYLCYTADSNCDNGKGNNITVSSCQPQFDKNGTLQGEYRLVLQD